MMSSMPGRVESYRRLLWVLGPAFLVSRLIAFFLFNEFESPGALSRVMSPALGGAFVIQAWTRPKPKELAMTAGLGVLAAVVHGAASRLLHANVQVTVHVLFGLGLASLLVAAVQATRSADEARIEWLSIFLPGAILATFVGVSTFFLGLTALLHPIVYDASVYAADDFFGRQPSFVVGRIFAEASYLETACRITYSNLPLAVAFVYGARRRRGTGPGDDILLSFVAVGFFGFVLYHLYPVVGPVFFFGNRFPNAALALPDPRQGYLMPIPVPRNCMPSLHTAWALLLYWHARPLRRYARVIAAAWLGLTVVATLGFGYHYAMDLVVAVPFTMAISASFTRPAHSFERDRRRMVAFGAVVTAVWLIALRFLPPVHGGGSTVRWLAALATVVSSFLFERSLYRRGIAEPGGRAADDSRTRAGSASAAEAAIAAVFFVSGFSGLIYEIVFAKSLAITFGSTATASTTVLATYMGGISLGAWIGGELGERRSDPLRVYALCEVAIALYCAATPWLFSGVRELYVAMATGIDPGRPILVPIQAALGALVLLPPTTLMGITLPVLSKQLFGRGNFGRAIGLLYGANTLGAAAGSWLAGYVVLSFLGVTGTTWLAVLANLCVGLMALRLSVKLAPPGIALADRASLGPNDLAAFGRAPRSSGVIAMVALGIGGMVTLALETTDIHLLAIVAGNSAYAFALMLFAFLIGLGLGASFARRLLRSGPATLAHLAGIELLLAATILAGVRGWDRIPAYFATFAGYPLTQSFGSRELIRFVVCSLMVIPPAFSIGALFPVAMDLVTRAADNPVRATGRASAINTIGNISGAIVGGFLLLPRLGSLRALEVLAAVAIGIAILPLVHLRGRRRWQVAIATVLALGLFARLPKSFDYDKLAAGTNVYFASSPHGHVIAHAESLDGGLTTVNETRTPEGARQLTLLTNGKFQGDNAGEMKAQYGYALYPLLHTSARDDALVIGLGTGVSAATVRWAGFRHLDIAELSSDIAHLTDTYFADVTGRVLRQPGVDLHITDVRNLLLLANHKYDLVTIEVTSIWVAGGASLYNREFYQLVKARLSPQGVLQQGVQLHRIGVEDIVSILGTVRSEFPRVWLYFTGSQGIIVSCSHDCEPSPATLARLENVADLAGPLSSLGGSVGGSIAEGTSRLVADRVLSPETVDQFLADVASRSVGVEHLVSTDDNLFLEYNTPRGNVRDYEASLRTNVALLRSYSPASLTDGTKLKEDDLARLRSGQRMPE